MPFFKPCFRLILNHYSKPVISVCTRTALHRSGDFSVRKMYYFCINC